MVGRTLDWQDELERSVSGLIGPGDRKSIQPMAWRLALGECDQLHHFIAAGVWDAAPGRCG
jgi:hypothetical protein